MNRTEMRELAFKLIYSLEIQSPDNIEEQIELYFQQNEIEDQKVIEYIEDIISGVNKNKAEIEDIIKKCLTEKWTIERISKINLSILKLAVYEIKYKDIPYKAEINEAVELAKKYGEDTSSRFINGALATAVKQMQLV